MHKAEATEEEKKRKRKEKKRKKKNKKKKKKSDDWRKKTLLKALPHRWIKPLDVRRGHSVYVTIQDDVIAGLGLDRLVTSPGDDWSGLAWRHTDTHRHTVIHRHT